MRLCNMLITWALVILQSTYSEFCVGSLHENRAFGIVAFAVLFAIPLGLWVKYVRSVKLGYDVFENEPEDDNMLEFSSAQNRNSGAATEEK